MEAYWLSLLFYDFINQMVCTPRKADSILEVLYYITFYDKHYDQGQSGIIWTYQLFRGSLTP
jgi:hypothetical protein